MKKILLISFLQIFSAVFYAQSLNFSLLNSKTTNESGTIYYEVDVMIASQAITDSFKMSSGQLYFNYNEDAFGSNVVANGQLEIIADETSLLGLKDNFYNLVKVYSDPILNDNTNSRFSIAWQQSLAGICVNGGINPQPQKLCRIRMAYQIGGEVYPSGVCYETAGSFTNQVYTICGPFPEDCSQLATSNCFNDPGVQVTNEELFCGSHLECYIEKISIAQAVSNSNCAPFGEEWIHLTNSLNETVFSVNPKGNDLGIINSTVFIDPETLTYDGKAFLKRHYLIESSLNPVTPIQLRVYFSQEEFEALQAKALTTESLDDDVNSIADLGITKYNGPTEDGILDLSDATDIQFISQFQNGVQFDSYYIEMKVSTLSEFWIHASALGALPLDLLSFTARLDGEHAVLNWETENEENMASFELEKSQDAKTFSTIAKINAVGNSTEKQNYSFRDLYPYDAVSYYRLKMVDLDGSFSYSELLTLEREAFSVLEVYPNPTKDLLYIHYQNPYGSDFDIEIFDLYGKSIKRFSQKANATNRIELSTTNFGNGMYIVEVHDGLYSFRKRFLKVD